MLSCLFVCLFVCLPASSLFARPAAAALAPFFLVFASTHDMLALATNRANPLAELLALPTQVLLARSAAAALAPFFGLCEHARNVGPANESRNPTFRTAGPANTSARSLPCAVQSHVRIPRQEVVLEWCCRDPLRETIVPASEKVNFV